MNVVAVINAMDIGGQGSRLAKAFARYGNGWTLRSMVKGHSYMGYSQDLPMRRAALEEQYQACDVFHARLDFGFYDQMAAKYGHRPVVVHHQGTKYRADPNRHIREAQERGAIMLVSTLDLWLLNPEAEWLPSPYDVDALMEIRRKARS